MKLKYVIAFIIPLFMLLLHINVLMYDFSFYQGEFEKLGVYDKYNEEIVDENALFVLDYVKHGTNLETDFFNEKEKIHLGDFRNIVRNSVYLLYFTGLVLIFSVGYLLFVKKYKLLFQSFSLGFIFTLVLLMLLVLGSLISFSFFFDLFHEIYPNDLYLLNPGVDNLIVLFPERFFLDISQRIILYTGISSIVLLLLAIVGKKRVELWRCRA